MNNNIENHSTGKDIATSVEWLALATAVVASITIIGWVVWYSRFGIDFTDEGYYLEWISNPWSYKASVTQFGFIYHPLYQLVGGDIVLLRRANLLITLGLAWILCFVLCRKIIIRHKLAKPSCSLPLVGVALVLSTSALALLGLWWLPTPNYYSLNLQALLIAGTGILLAEANTSRNSLKGWVLIGVS